MEAVTKILLFIHVISGASALFTGTIAAFLRKRRGLHSLMGTIFTFAMYVVSATGVPLALFKGNIFLFAVAIFTVYMVITGSNAFKGIAPAKRKVLAVFGLLAGATLISLMLYLILGSSNYFGIVPGVFGDLLTSMSINDLRISRGKKYNPLTLHMNQMGGSLIAAYTAFLTAGFTSILSRMGFDLSNIALFLWLLPTVIGSLLLTRANIKVGRAKKSFS